MNHRLPRALLITSLMIVAIPFAAFAANPVGGGSVMDWQVNSTSHEKATLTWSCADGEVGSTEFKNGKNISLHIRDLGTEITDGVCSWELRLSPRVSSDVAKKLESARAANDDKAARKIMKAAGFDPDAMVMSGAFTIQNGSFVNTEGTEDGANDATTTRRITTNARPEGPIAVNDQVIPDDLIVQGSICAGFDCVNNESFGFDTIRLKENNLRIKAEDTSVGTFPTNDWQLTFNDSASGGASKFSVEDITGAKVPMTIEAGATTNSLFVDSTGRIGFRTATPVLDLHINTSNTPGIRLEQNNSGGFTAQTWDIAGNEANFFVRDVTSGSRLPFRIRPGAPTSSIDISADGDVGIGTASPDEKLHVVGTDNPRILIEDTSDGANDKPGFVLRSPAAASAGDWAFEVDNLGNFQIDFGPSSGPEILISDTTAGNSAVTINGSLNVVGGCTGCDRVFQPDFPLESIEEHSSFMFEKSYLPGVGPTPEGKVAIDVFQKTTGILQELEKAHIYIDQLNKKLEAQEAKFRDEMAQLKSLVETNLAEQQP